MRPSNSSRSGSDSWSDGEDELPHDGGAFADDGEPLPPFHSPSGEGAPRRKLRVDVEDAKQDILPRLDAFILIVTQPCQTVCERGVLV